MNYFKYAFFLTPIILVGCAKFQGTPLLDIIAPEHFVNQPVSTVADTSVLPHHWWNTTDDMVLVRLIQRIEKQNLSLKQARFRLAAARFESHQGQYLPNINVGADAQFSRLLKGDNGFGGFSRFGSPATQSSITQSNTGQSNTGQSGGRNNTTGYYNAKLDASWEIPLYGQYDTAGELEQSAIALAEADGAAMRASIISEGIRLYSTMRELQQELVARKRIIDASQKIVSYQNIKHGAGLITDSERDASQQSLLIAETDVADAQNTLEGVRQQLAGLLGKTIPDAEWDNVVDVPSFTLPAFADTPLTVMENRPDIATARASVMQAAAQLDLAESELYPKLSLTGSLSQLGNITGNALSGNTVQLTGIPALSLPLLDWGKRLNAAKARDAQLSETAMAHRETVIKALNEVEEFWAAYRTAQTTQKALHTNASIANRANDHAQLLFTQGITSGIEAENAVIASLRTDIAEVQARAATITRLIALAKALGNGTIPKKHKKVL